VEGDTIAAIATAQGPGAIAVVRISGPRTLAVLEAMFAPGASLPAPREARLRSLHDPGSGELIDRALVTTFRAPDSFTGEDAAELSCHGGRLTPALVLAGALSAGCRRADPGEFTRRAYLNGKLDLLQAEAIGELIDADSPALRRSAVFRMERGLSERVEGLREAIIRVDALLSYGIDFPEEDEPPVPAEAILGAAAEARQRMEHLLRTFPEGQRLRKGALVVLAGRPNSGKSSLFNALLGRERAIVTEVAGTTRDALEVDTNLEGYPFRLVDTAGLRTTGDRVEAMGVEVARRFLEEADLVLYCTEAGREMGEDERTFLEESTAPVVLVRTKADRAGALENGAKSVLVSSLSGVGLDRLRRELRERAFGGSGGEEEVPLLTRERHARALRGSIAALEEFQRALQRGEPPEFASVHLRDAVTELEELVGRVSPDDVLDEVFGRFCVGK